MKRIFLIICFLLTACVPQVTPATLPAVNAPPAPRSAPLDGTVEPFSGEPVNIVAFSPTKTFNVVTMTPNAVPAQIAPLSVQSLFAIIDTTGLVHVQSLLKSTEAANAEIAVAVGAGMAFDCAKIAPLVENYLGLAETQAIIDAVWMTGAALELGGYTLLGSVSGPGFVQLWLKGATSAGYVVLTLADSASPMMPGGFFGVAAATNAETVVRYMSTNGAVFLSDLGANELGNVTNPLFVLRSNPQADAIVISTLVALGSCLKKGSEGYAEKNTTKGFENPRDRIRVEEDNNYTQYVILTMKQEDVQAYLNIMGDAVPYVAVSAVVVVVACYATGMCEIAIPTLLLFSL